EEEQKRKAEAAPRAQPVRRLSICPAGATDPTVLTMQALDPLQQRRQEALEAERRRREEERLRAEALKRQAEARQRAVMQAWQAQLAGAPGDELARAQAELDEPPPARGAAPAPLGTSPSPLLGPLHAHVAPREGTPHLDRSAAARKQAAISPGPPAPAASSSPAPRRGPSVLSSSSPSLGSPSP